MVLRDEDEDEVKEASGFRHQREGALVRGG